MNFYRRELVTFPSVLDVRGRSAVRLEFVPDGRWQSGPNGGFNLAEARRIADLVMQYARETPDRSLGVITMNQRQQIVVIEEIEKRRRQYPELEAFFDTNRLEPFFVKNLENVQGDQRDTMLLGIGYAPDQSGSLAMRFGPLNLEGGERRLNVAVTRACDAMVVVSSIRAHDIDLSRTSAKGARLLRDYLDFAERGLDALASRITEEGRSEADSPFEEEVARALRERGLDVRMQVGCGNFRIDLALTHPEQPGRYVLGIECDGATYHSSATARDRDRLRQSVLEELGWRICRIWSTDWVRDPAKQVAKVIAAHEMALNEPDAFTRPNRENADAAVQPQPAPVKMHNGLPQYNHSRIEDVQDERIEELVRHVLAAHGATDEHELIVTVARHLGFARTGKRINDRVAGIIESLECNATICRSDDRRVRLAK